MPSAHDRHADRTGWSARLLSGETLVFAVDPRRMVLFLGLSLAFLMWAVFGFLLAGHVAAGLIGCVMFSVSTWLIVMDLWSREPFLVATGAGVSFPRQNRADVAWGAIEEVRVSSGGMYAWPKKLRIEVSDGRRPHAFLITQRPVADMQALAEWLTEESQRRQPA